MAHKGKTHKVWFRRDLSVSQNETKFYYPEQFVFDELIGITSDLFEFNGLEGQLLTNTYKGPSTERKWVGLPSSPGFIKVIPEIEVVDTNWGLEEIFHFRLKLINTFRVLDFKMRNNAGKGHYTQWFSNEVLEIIILDTRIDYIPGGFSVAFVPNFYS